MVIKPLITPTLHKLAMQHIDDVYKRGQDQPKTDGWTTPLITEASLRFHDQCIGVAIGDIEFKGNLNIHMHIIKRLLDDVFERAFTEYIKEHHEKNVINGKGDDDE